MSKFPALKGQWTMSKYTDKALLDFLETEGCGIAVIHDDMEHWCVATDGMQQIAPDGPF